MKDLTLEEIKHLIDRLILAPEIAEDTYSRGWNAALLILRDDVTAFSRFKKEV